MWRNGLTQKGPYPRTPLIEHTSIHYESQSNDSKYTIEYDMLNEHAWVEFQKRNGSDLTPMK